MPADYIGPSSVLVADIGFNEVYSKVFLVTPEASFAQPTTYTRKDKHG
jgi:hypothetical protein